MGDQGFSRDRRVRRRAEFLAAYETGRKVHGRFVTLFARPNALVTCRLGVSVTRKQGPATVRNAAKRRLREIFRAATFPAGLDLVIVPKREFFDADFSAIRADVLAAVERATRSTRPATDRPHPPARRPVRH
jgi:ribonuclease P protein component